MNDVNLVLKRIENGDKNATGQLLTLVYDELRRLAQKKLAQELPGQTLNATGLVHEAFLRLINSDQQQVWDTIGHFYAAAAESMRRILIEIARRKASMKHGGNFPRLDVDTMAIECKTNCSEWAGEMIDLDKALSQMAEQHPRAANLVHLRYFTGLSMEEAAKSLCISRRTAQRHWTFARAWLYCQINGSDEL